MWSDDVKHCARLAGGALLVSIVIGMVSAFTISSGIDVNLTADMDATARAMLAAETRLNARAYVTLLLMALELLFLVGLGLILWRKGEALIQLIAIWSIGLGLCAIIANFLGAVTAMNAAQIAARAPFQTLASPDLQIVLAALQAMTEYTSFHLGIVLSSLSKAGLFALLLKTRLIPKLIAGWGLFASLFVAIAIVARDFIPVLGSDLVTAGFMISNLIALLTLGGYLAIFGVKASPAA